MDGSETCPTGQWPTCDLDDLLDGGDAAAPIEDEHDGEPAPEDEHDSEPAPEPEYYRDDELSSAENKVDAETAAAIGRLLLAPPRQHGQAPVIGWRLVAANATKTTVQGLALSDLFWLGHPPVRRSGRTWIPRSAQGLADSTALTRKQARTALAWLVVQGLIIPSPRPWKWMGHPTWHYRLDGAAIRAAANLPRIEGRRSNQSIVAELREMAPAIGYYPWLRRVCGSEAECLLLGWLCWWYTASEGDGRPSLRALHEGHRWLAMPYAAIANDKLGVSEYVVERAAAGLAARGLIDREPFRADKYDSQLVVHFRVHADALLAALGITFDTFLFFPREVKKNEDENRLQHIPPAENLRPSSV
jgi:hypothetical protein